MTTKVVWVLYLIIGGGVLDETSTTPLTKIPLTRFWTEAECGARLKKYDNPDGRAKLKEMAGGQGYFVACFSREVVTGP